MKKLAIAFLLLFAATAFAQDPYPYPQPKPTTGDTPTTVIRLNQPIGPMTYSMFAPAVWDTDIGGGLQSRTNAQDRANVRWLRLGAIVMDQTDRTYYGVDVKEDGTLAAYRPLFTLDGGIAGDTSIYKGDGQIAGSRFVDLNNNSLTFSGTGLFAVGTTGVLLDTGPLQAFGDSLDLMGRNSLRLRTPGTLHSQVQDGWVLTLTDKATGAAEWVAPQGANGTIVDTSIYLNDGGITQDRTMLLNQHTLKFDGGSQTGAGVFSVENAGVARILANNIQFTDYSTLSFSTPKTRAGQVNNGDALIVTSANGITPATVEFGRARDTSIYTDNGGLTSDRDFNGQAFGLTMRNLSTFTLGAGVTTIGGQSGFFLTTPDVWNHFSRDNQVLTLINKDTGQVEYRDAPVGKNIYNTSDVLTSDRTVSGGNRKLTFTGVSDFNLSGQNTTVEGTASVSVKTPQLSAANPGYVLTLQNKTTGATEFKPTENLYNANGTLGSDRTVDASGRLLRVNNASTLDLKGQNTSVSGTTALNLLTPGVNSRTASSGQVLTLADTNTGRVEFSSIVFPTITDTSIYNSSGTLSGDRSVNLAGRNIDFVGSGSERFQIYYAKTFAVFGLTNNLWGTNQFLFGSPQSVLMDAPGLHTGTQASNAGKVLMLTDPVTSAVDLISPTNLYSGDGVLLGNRNVYGSLRSLGFTNMNELSLQASKLRILTPAVKQGIAAGGYSLQLKDTATGEVEFGPTGTTGGDGSIYTIDGALQADRTVTMGGRNLDWTGNGSNNRFQLYNLGAFAVYAKTNDLFGPYLFRINAPTNFMLLTPKVATSGAAALAGQVLTLNADGTSDFATVTAQGTDTSIYKGSGSLLGNTTVNGAGFGLTFNNLNSFIATTTGPSSFTQISGDTTVLNGVNSLKLQPPNYAAAPVGTVLTKTSTDGASAWQPLPAPPKTIYTGDGDITSSRTVRQNNLGLSFDGGGGGYFGVANQGTVDIGANNTSLRSVSSLKLGTPKVTANQAAGLVGGVLTLKAANGDVEFAAFPGSANIYNTSSALTDNRDVGLSGKYLKFNGPGAVEFNSSGSPFSISGASTILAQSSSTLTLSGGGGVKVQTPKVLSVSKPSIGDTLTYTSAGDGTVEFQTPLTIYNNDGILTTGGNNTRRVDGNQKAFTMDNLVSYTVDSANVYLTGRSAIRIGTKGAIAGGVQNYVLTSTDNNGTAEWQPIASGGPTLYTANDSIKTPRTVTLGANSLTFTGNGVLGGSFNVGNVSSLNLASAGSVSIEAASGNNFLKLRTPKVTKGDGGVAQNWVLTMQSTDGSAEWAPVPADVNIYRNNGDMIGGKRTVTGNAQGITWNNMGPYEMFTSTHLQQASSAMYIQTPSFRSANSDGKKWVLTMQDPTTGRVEFETPPAGGTSVTQNTIYTHDDNIFGGDRTVGGAGGVYGLTFSGLKHFNVAANSQNIGITGNSTFNTTGNNTVSANGAMQVVGGGQLFILGGTQNASASTVVSGAGPFLVGTSSRTAGNFKIATPLVQNATDASTRNNYVLTLSTDGSAEWKPAQGGAGATIYTQSAEITGSDRVVSGGATPYGLSFLSLKHFNSSSTTADLSSGGNFTIRGGTASGTTKLKGVGITEIGTESQTAGALKIKTPLVNAPGGIPADIIGSAVLTLTASDGSVEFKAPNTVSGLVEYYGNLTGTIPEAQPCPEATLTLNPSTPDFSADTYKDFMRVTARVASNAGHNHVDQKIRLKVGSNANAPAKCIVSPGGILANGGDIQSGMVLEMIYDEKVKPRLSTGVQIGETGGWVLLDFGIGTGLYCGFNLLNAPQGTNYFKSRSQAVEAGVESAPVAPGQQAAQVGANVLTATTSDGSVEFKRTSLNTGIIEYYGNTDNTVMNPPNPAFIHMTTSTPMYTAGTTVDYPDYTRVTARANTDVLNGNRQTIYFSLGNGPDRPLQNPLHNNLVPGDLRPGMIMEMIYNASMGRWILLDFGIGSDEPQRTRDTAAAPAQVMTLTTPARSPVTVVTLVGVVDSMADLAAAPTSFKKLSTLGMVTVGDGRHADYFLTAYDPIISPAYAVRSTIETNKMWKQLIAK